MLWGLPLVALPIAALAARGTGRNRGRSSAASTSVARLAVAEKTKPVVVDTGGRPSGAGVVSLAQRRVMPVQGEGPTPPVVKVVYVVLEGQYQASLSAAVKTLNKTSKAMAVECMGYFVEELRSPETFEAFKSDLSDANVLICSLVFEQEVADLLVEAVTPERERLDACVVFPSMPEVMKMNKLGSFDLAQLSGGGPLSGFIDAVKDAREKMSGDKKGKPEATGGAFKDSLLKLVRTLPKVLKFLPGDQANDARTFVLALQHWLGGTPENLEAMLLRVAAEYVPAVRRGEGSECVDVAGLMEPVLLPDTGIWHPLAGQGQIFDTAAEYNEWCDAQPHLQGTPVGIVGLILQKSHIATRDDGHYVALIQGLEKQGARVIPVYTGGLDFSKPVEQFFFGPGGEVVVDCVVNLTGFSLVGGPASQDSKKAKEVLGRLNRPYMVSVPLCYQSFDQWEQSELGLHPVQVALQVSLPEIDGAIEPLIFSGRDQGSGRSIPLADRIDALASRALKWAALRRKENAEKKLGIVMFQFPPDKGNVGTAAYLDVFGSILNVMRRLKGEGYTIDDIPDTVEELIACMVDDPEQTMAMSDLNVAYRMNVDEYEELCPYAEDLRENWGPPPGKLNTDGQNLLVFGRRFGNVFIGVQPTFGYEGDPMQLLFAKSASPHHGFAAFYTYMEKIFDADCTLHFGTHGSLEFMPGKQVGMSGSCYPDKLISALPNLYYYAANNPSEATVAKRRSYASTISYLTPPAENAGLYKGLDELKGLIESYQSLRESEARGPSITASIVATAWRCNFDKDVSDLPSEDESFKGASLAERDLVVGKVYRVLMEIESRTLPMGLHRIGVPPTAEESIATLVSIASIDRADEGIEGLPRLCARAMGRDMEQVYAGVDRGTLEDVELSRRITEATRAAVRALVEQSVSEDGRVSDVNPMLADISAFLGQSSPWRTALVDQGFEMDESALSPLFAYLEFCLEQIVKDNELGALVGALNAEYITPGPGGDPIRNPGVLPTGKNMHALDPQGIPTKAAVATAYVVVDRLLGQLKKDSETGEYPESIAFTLWGTDNIKTYGESLAQVLALVGVRPVMDSLGRVNKVEVIPLEELGRPRIDVVCNCSGVFRDLFLGQMTLLDKGIKAAAEMDEPLDQNFVRKHALEQAEEMKITLRQAATRVFSNAAGSYSANVGLAIENSTEGVDEQALQEQFLNRKGFAISSDSAGYEMTNQNALFKSSLAKVDCTFQNLDSTEISLTDVSHYFDSDPTKVVQGLRKDGKKPMSMIADTTTANAQVRSLAGQVRLDSRTKLLNPKFYERALSSGYEGVREISKRLKFTSGWSTTSGEVDAFVYEDANETYIKDKELAMRMLEKNPNALKDMVQTFLETDAKGFWEATEEDKERLMELYQMCEEKIEGVDFVESSFTASKGMFTDEASA